MLFSLDGTQKPPRIQPTIAEVSGFQWKQRRNVRQGRTSRNFRCVFARNPCHCKIDLTAAKTECRFAAFCFPTANVSRMIPSKCGYGEHINCHRLYMFTRSSNCRHENPRGMEANFCFGHARSQMPILWKL